MPDFIQNILDFIVNSWDAHWINAIKAVWIIVLWTIIWRIVYLLMIKIFEKFKIIEFIDKILCDLQGEEKLKEENIWKTSSEKFLVFSKRVDIEWVVSKAFAYYVFIVFFRLAIMQIGITDVEKFLADVINYLPSLFIWGLVLFFGIRFSGFIYDVVYHALSLQNEKTAKVLAYFSKGIILFFTALATINYIKIVDEFIIHTIFIGTISMIALAWGLAFWLGWKDIAKEILESFKK